MFADFDCRQHLEHACACRNIKTFHSIRVHYQAGWSVVIEELLDAFEGTDVELALVEDWSRVLNVRFRLPEDIDPADEVKVWRAVDKARIRSMQQCMRCARPTRSRYKYGKGELLCTLCEADV